MGEFRLAGITLDETSIVRRTRQIEQEREIAIYDLLAANSFAPIGSEGGPYLLGLGIEDSGLVFDIRLADGSVHGLVALSLGPLRGLIRDYFLICESYYRAIRSAPPAQIESLDMGRRALHDEGGLLLQKHLEGKIVVDFDTARRLFTLICVLQARG